MVHEPRAEDDVAETGGAETGGAAESPRNAAARIRKPPFGARPQFYPAPTSPYDPGYDPATAPDPVPASPSPSLALPTIVWPESGRTIAVAATISAVWSLAFVVYITATIGWRELFTLLPDQFGSFMAMFLMPLAFLWLVVAYLDRGRQLRREGEALRAHLAQLTYPSDHAVARVNTITDSLKLQAQSLAEATEYAAKQPNIQLLEFASGHELTDVLDEMWTASRKFLLGQL